ncbi:ATP-dependent DNA helicase RecG [Streptomyces zhaozhouensis]|uniref:ATP-dependent DNA helicase RecG n=1 Tax=Streptomyces zhaozhouensis TaxID=1300267 RepID=A0A286DZY7_9ACTN|nr:OB-fold nucleic acid binding domain-containing protein [Streptomyces zhaozhouensis]SOD64226.1 ATP-dependent DNA helicase RecG [Streptomyces zhaozhouensis]
MSAEGRAGKRGGRLWRLLGRPEAGEPGEDLAADPAAVPCTRIGDCAGTAAARPVVRVTGTLRAVRERSVAGMPALEARLDDGSASLNVVWLGRRAIPGIEPGREMVASGRIAVTDGRAVLFNPRYQLQARGQE